MSLMDAMLNEGYRDPRDVYIALRTDGVKGSGTIADPFNGNHRVESALAGATVGYNPLEVIVTVDLKEDEALGYSNGTSVELSGAIGGVFNGTFTVKEVLNSRSFTILVQSVPVSEPPVESVIRCKSSNPPKDRQAWLSWCWAKVTNLPANHGLALGDIVQIAEAPQAALNGRFLAQYFGATSFRYWLASKPTGSVSNPVAINCAKVVLGFDEAMRNLPEDAVIHLGAGVFETKGYSQNGDSAWQPKAGQKILGSGMAATTLQLVHARVPGDEKSRGTGKPTHAIGSDYYPFIDHLEVRDLTMDCNVFGQAVPAGREFAEVSCGAIAVGGSFQRIQRVRVINFGTQTRDIECFLIGVAGPHPSLTQPVNSVIEDCIVEQPSPNNVRESSALATWGTSPAQHRGCVIRNNWINFEYAGKVSSHYVMLHTITMVRGENNAPTRVYELTTRDGAPHHRIAANNVKVNGVMVAFWNRTLTTPALDWRASAALNGSFKVLETTGSDKLQFELRQNPDFGFKLTQATLAKIINGNPTTAIALESITSLDTDPTPLRYRIKTAGGVPHGWSTGNPTALRLSGVEIARLYQSNGQTVFGFTASEVFNKDWAANLVTVFSDTELDVTIDSVPVSEYIMSAPDGYFHLSAATIGVNFQGMGANGGTGGVAEGNRIWGGHVAHYHDTGTLKDVTVRENLFYDVIAGGYWYMGSLDLKDGGGYLTHQGNLAIFERRHPTVDTAIPHGFSPGDIVFISRAQVGSTPEDQYPSKFYNGYFEIESVLEEPSGNPVKLTYRMDGDPGADALLSPRPQIWEFFRARQVVVDDNVMVLTPTLPPDAAGSWGVLLSDSRKEDERFPDIFRRICIRGNVIGQLDEAPNDRTQGIGVASGQSGIVEGNICQLTSPKPLWNFWSQTAYSHNQFGDGSYIEAVQSGVPARPISDVKTSIADALLMGML